MSENGETLDDAHGTHIRMSHDAVSCHRALRARDRRFDGVFYVGVRTTGVYCRPICPARTPAPERCEFFTRAAEAERAGFRACFRCRPELAPGLAVVDSIPRLVRAAAARIDAGYLNDHSIEELAAALGVTSRHLRRSIESELGVSPVQLAQTRRLAVAKQLLHDTTMTLTRVAFAAGFASVRRFNAAFRERFGRAPSALRPPRGEAGGQGRTGGGAGGDPQAGDSLRLRLDYRPPLDWTELLSFLRDRAIAGVETVGAHEYRRTVALGDCAGWVAVTAAQGRSALYARVSLSLATKVTEVAARLRALFDLDARPDVVAAQLRRDRALRPLVAARPGLRVPGAFDPFETAIRAVLGQQISVRAATTLSGRLAARFGIAVVDGFLFPTAAVLARVDVSRVRAIGLPDARARTIVGLARAVVHGRVDLASGADPAGTLAALQAVPGIGPWTAQYVAMRALRWPDAFPAGDLALHKALGVTSARAAEQRAVAWRPWRAYAVLHLWNSLKQETADVPVRA